MRKFLAQLSLGAAAACTVTGAYATGTVEVAFVEPDKFTDIGFSTYDRDRTLQDMTALLQQFAAKLPDGQTLKLEVTDIDLAGEERMGRRHDLRTLRGRTDWPQVNLRYTLLAGASTLKSGEARIQDLAYQSDRQGLSGVGTNLPYERRMLRKWFAETIAPLH